MTVFRGVVSKHANFCRPLEDYSPREDAMEERKVCKTTFEKDCQPVTEADCMEVTELRCEVSKQGMVAIAAITVLFTAESCHQLQYGLDNERQHRIHHECRYLRIYFDSHFTFYTER